MSPVHVLQMSPVHVFQMSPIHVFQMSPVHVLQMSPVHVLQMSPVHVLQMSSVQVLQVQSRFYNMPLSWVIRFVICMGRNIGNKSLLCADSHFDRLSRNPLLICPMEFVFSLYYLYYNKGQLV
jgi:hypothetical protein